MFVYYDFMYSNFIVFSAFYESDESWWKYVQEKGEWGRARRDYKDDSLNRNVAKLKFSVRLTENFMQKEGAFVWWHNVKNDEEELVTELCARSLDWSMAETKIDLNAAIFIDAFGFHLKVHRKVPFKPVEIKFVSKQTLHSTERCLIFHRIA